MAKSGENFSSDFSEGAPVSVDSGATEYVESREAICEERDLQRQFLSGDVSDPLMEEERPILMSYDDSYRVNDLGESFDKKTRSLYRGYISEIIADTLRQRGPGFSSKLMYKAKDELPKNVKLRTLHEEAVGLFKEKGAGSDKRLNAIAIEVQKILKGYSLVFVRTTFDKYLVFQAKSKTNEEVAKLMTLEEREVYQRSSESEKRNIMVMVARRSGNTALLKKLEYENKVLEDIKKKEQVQEQKQQTAKKEKTVVPDGSKATETSANKAAAYEQANYAISNSGSSYSLSRDGTLTFSRDFSVKVDVDDQGQYYLVDDKFANKGKVGPFNLREFPVKAYERYIDAYVSKKIRGRLKDPDQISGVKDEYLVTVGKALLGGGKKNGYKIEGEDKLVLDGLVESLLVQDKTYENLSKRMYALYKHVRADHNMAVAIRRKLLGAADGRKRYSVSELMGEKTEG